MSASLTAWGASQLAGTFFAGTYTKPASFWIALCMQAPDDNADGTMLTEPASGIGYTRVNVTNSGSNFSTPASGVITNVSPISWSIATADWGTISNYAVCDAPTGGNCYFWAGLSLPRLVENGHVFLFSPGMLTIFTQTSRDPLLGLHPL